MKHNITIYDIAREADVSPSTVSRVLTGSARVNVEKSRRIREIMEMHNFHPNALARSLLKKESNIFGVVLPDIVNPFYASIFLEIERQALARGYSIILTNSVNEMLEQTTNSESECMKTLIEKQVDGIIFMGGRVNTVRTDKVLAGEMNTFISKMPVVMINGRMAGVDCHKVRSDEREGIFSIIEYLMSLGHSKIGFIGGISNITSTSIKLKALRDALGHYGLNYNDKWMILSSFSIESGFEAMKELLSNRERPTAVVSVNDFVAIGAMNYASSMKIRIPEDISITGFDDTYLCNVVSPALTSVSHNIPELAKVAIDMLCNVIAGRNTSRESIIRTSLVIKESCAAP